MSDRPPPWQSPEYTRLMVQQYLDGDLCRDMNRPAHALTDCPPSPHRGLHQGRAKHGFPDLCPVCLGTGQAPLDRVILYEAAGWHAFADLRDLCGTITPMGKRWARELRED